MASPMIATSSRWPLILLLGLGACARQPLDAPASPAIQPTPLATNEEPDDGDLLQGSVVAVLSEGQAYDFTSPWAKQRPWSRRMTGLVVEGNRILVAGGLLANSTLIEVQKRGEPQRYPAKVVIADYELPLTLLEVEDPRFFADLSPLPIAAELPEGGGVAISRWLGSGQFETAEGNIRQVVVQDHFPGRTPILSLDVSSAIESNGASDVVIAEEEVVGLCTAKTESQLRVMGGPVLRQFLERAAQKSYAGFARHAFGWQSLTNPALRRHLGVPEGSGGLLIRKILPRSSGAGVLETGDVLLELGGYPIDQSGKFDHPRYGKLFFSVLFTDGRAPGDPLPAVVLRNKEKKTLQIPLRRMDPDQDVVPPYINDRAPEHLVLGGLVFQTLSKPYLETWREWWKNAPLRMLVAFDQVGPFPPEGQARIVVLSRVLPDPVNLGYQDLEPMIITAVNGRPATDLAAVAAAWRDPVGGFQVIDTLPGQSTSRIVLDAQAATEAEPRIRALYGITPGAKRRP